MTQNEKILMHMGQALIYANDVLNSYEYPEYEDKRPELLGALSAAERDISSVNSVLFKAISTFREKLQTKRFYIDQEDLYYIKSLWLAFEEFTTTDDIVSLDKKNAEKFNVTIIEQPAKVIATARTLTEAPVANVNAIASTFTTPVLDDSFNNGLLDVVYLPIKNKTWFDISINSIRMHLRNTGKFFVVDAPNDIIERKHVESIHSFDDERLSENFIVLNDNMGMLKEYDAQKLFPIFNESCPSELLKDFNNLKNRLVAENIDGIVYVWDGIRPQPVNKAKWLETYNKFHYDAMPLTAFYTYTDQTKFYVGLRGITVFGKRICCATRLRLKESYFATWTTDEAFESLLEKMNLGNYTYKG